MTRRTWRKWIWGFLAAAVVASVVWFQLRGINVRTVAVARKDILRTVVASGRILSPSEVNVGSLLSGTVAAVLVREGQRVHAGELLVQLDDSAAKAQARQAEARVSDARSGQRSVVSVDVPAAAEQLQQARTRLAQQQRDAARTKELVSKQALPPAEAEAADTQLRLAESQVTAAELQLAAVSRGGSGAQRAAAAMALAEAQLERARVELDQTRIRTLTDGIILKRLVEPGDAVSPGTPLLVLSAVGSTRVTIEPDERCLADLALGQPARVSTEAFPSLSFEATVAYLAPSVNPRRGTIEVRLDVANPPAYLRPDMTVSVEILVGQERQAIVIPAAAINDRLQSSWVYVVKQGRLERRNVRLGAADSTHVQVIEGLEADEIVVTEGGASLREAQRVRPLREDDR